MSSSIPANLIRQWCFCPRIVYYIELTDFTVSYPLWVTQGEEFHRQETLLWQRRNLSRFGLQQGDVHLNFPARSEKYGIHGIADMVIETESAIYPVEFKLELAKQKRGGIYQLVAYGLMLEDMFQKKCPCGFLTKGRCDVQRIEMTQTLSSSVLGVTEEIRQMLELGAKPDSPASIKQCSNCEYLNHCNDRG
ncbi:CRISPR-associated protein Cas4 [Desulfoplanes sp. PS50]